MDETRQYSRTTLLLFLSIAFLIGLDVVGDLMSGSSLAHVLVEGAILLMAAVGAAQIWFQNWRLSNQTRQLDSALKRSRQEGEEWRREASTALAGLGVAVDRQFERWSLTSAESDVALLLLKGLGFKEIAHVRGVSERTVRDQARAVYRKGQLEGRADLAAYFLEDLLLPAASSK